MKQESLKSFDNEDETCSVVAANGNPVSRRSLTGQSLTHGGDTITCPGPSALVAAQGLAGSSVSSFASVSACVAIFRADPHSSVMREMIMDHQHQDISATDTTNKLSPKVYSNYSKSLVHSMEDLKPTTTAFSSSFLNSYANKTEPRPWGSLQEMRNIGSCAMDSCLVREHFFLFTISLVYSGTERFNFSVSYPGNKN